jgi:uncharacterized membrane protein YgaE (UPF0421/DUF939 family)
MTFILWYIGGLVTALLLNYALHQPNKEYEKRLKKLEEKLYHNFEN